MKTPLLIISLSLSLTTVFAQITFEKTFGGRNFDSGVSSIQTANGNLVLVSNSSKSLSGDSDISLAKMDSKGDTIWTKTYGELGDDFCHAIQQTSNNGFLIVGTTNSLGNGDTDILLIKTDSNGVMLWSKIYGGSGNESGLSIEYNNDNSFLVAGYTESFGSGMKDMFILHIDADGGEKWNKTFGGSNNDVANSIKKTNDGGYIITGTSNSFSAGGDDDVYLMKIDVNGNKIWSKAIGGINQDSGNSGLQNADGGYMVIGNTASFGIGDTDIYLIKTNSDGDVLFSNTYNSSYEDFAKNITPTSDGQFVLSAFSGSQMFNSGGSITLTSGSISTVGTIDTTVSGSTLETVSTNDTTGSTTGNVDSDISLIKLDANGVIIWAKKFGGLGADGGNDVIQTNDGGYLISATSNVVGTNDFDSYLIKTNSDGGTSCGNVSYSFIDSTVVSTSSVPTDFASSGTLTTTDNLVISFTKEYTMTTNCFNEVVDPNSFHSVPTGIANDIIIDNGNGNEIRTVSKFSTINNDISLNVFPNPNEGKLVNISISSTKGEELLVVVYDALGREHYSKIVVVENENENVYAIDLSEKLIPGIYFIKASSKLGNETKRLIVK
ncbi:MAG: T9SS type A sorting domain-containing protein [Bacteroidetes bacterium]|nr:T9SS type A sorting domain-containing protein [Bacteroidota bacterium]